MPRRPSVRYWESRGGYGCWIGGKQYLLAKGPDDYPDGPTYRAAARAFGELVAGAAKYQARDANPVYIVLDAYVHHCLEDRKEDSFQQAKWVCQRFVKECAAAQRPCAELTQAIVADWVSKNRQPRKNPINRKEASWGPSTRRIAIRVLKTAFNHAKKIGLVDTNPLAGMEMPRPVSRGKEAAISDEDHARVVDYARSSKRLAPFLELVTMLEETGARPGEIAKATAGELKKIHGVWVFDLRKWKTERTARARVIPLSLVARELALRLARRNPDGCLLRCGGGGPWIRPTMFKAFYKCREKLGVPGLTSYSYRHRFATQWLLAGRSIAVLAQILGNSVKTIETHYGHLVTDMAAITRQLEEFRAGRGASGETPQGAVE